MRNLKLSYSGFVVDDVLKNADAFCIDSDTQTVYFANSQQLFYLEKNSSEIKNKILDLGTDHSNSHIVTIDYVFDTQFLCLSLSSGDVAVYNIPEEKAEIVGCVDSGILNAAWSPDQELFVIISGTETFIIMTKDFDPLLERYLHPEEFGESSPVNVGWGSKETQFHGSEGKGAAKTKVVVSKPVVPWDDMKPRVSWRSDGDLFVISVVDPTLCCRKLRIWSREGILQYTSEMKDGLEQPLSWRPSGALIACTQQHPNKHEVIFFEKNGLHHGEFKLPYKPDTFVVKELLWNIDSTTLAIWGHELNNASKYTVMVWAVKNYHWYLKQNLKFNAEDNFAIKQVLWDPQLLHKLYILGNNGQFYQYTWSLTTHCNTATTGEDDCSVVVIDNDCVLITPFKKTVVPPPMCAYSFSCPVSINEITFAPGSEDFCLILSNGELAFFAKDATANDIPLPEGYKKVLQAAGGNGFRTMVKPHSFLGAYSIKWESCSDLHIYPLCFNNWTWCGDNQLFCIYCDYKFGVSKLLSLDVSEIGHSDLTIINGKFCIDIKGIVVGMCSNERDPDQLLAIQLNDGNILTYSEGKLSPWMNLMGNEAVTLKTPCPQFSICDIGDKVVVLALSGRYTLYCNNVALVPKCTSYCIHDDFLIITTCDNKLKCYLKISILDGVKDAANFTEVAAQQCEAGSRIVRTVTGDTKVILQMPRGNLEAIHPRPLVLSAISRYLDKMEYKKAFDIAKKHRIDMNILYDYYPKRFLDNVETFVEQINLSADLNLFLVSLTNENISSTLYPFQTLYDTNPCPKKDLVCDVIQKVLKSKDINKYFDTLMATYSQKTEPELDRALIEIKNMKDKSGNEDLADKALKFLLWLVDVNELYKVGLGTYDFKIAVMVAEKSNMDPKEYLSFMNELQELDEEYRKYKIDMHLGRHKKALEHISKCENHFDECLNLIRNQRLYTSALYLFEQGSTNFKDIWNEYGDYLVKKMYYKEAGLAFNCCEEFEKAMKAFQQSGDWQLAICASGHLKYSEDKLLLLYSNLADKLKQQSRYEEASSVLRQYAEDIPGSIAALIEGHCWESAILAILQSNNKLLLQTKFIPALFEHYKNLITLLADKEEDFIRHSERLEVVRQKRESSGGKYDDTADDDLYSETSSMTGTSSQGQASKQLSGSLITRKSSRSRRKLELKKFRLKEGSANEDLALISELADIVTLFDKIKDNFFSFIRMLVQFDFQIEATTIQKKFKHVIATVETEMPNIWKILKPSGDLSFGPDFTTNSILDVVQMQRKTIQSLSDPALAPPTWRKNIDIFLELAN